MNKSLDLSLERKRPDVDFVFFYQEHHKDLIHFLNLGLIHLVNMRKTLSPLFNGSIRPLAC